MTSVSTIVISSACPSETRRPKQKGDSKAENELNAMTTRRFIEWLDSKMAEHGCGKLVPPADVITAELRSTTKEKLRAAITDRILREAGIDDQVAAAIAATEEPSAAVLAEGIRSLFRQEPRVARPR
jgi:hypothetical protein